MEIPNIQELILIVVVITIFVLVYQLAVGKGRSGGLFIIYTFILTPFLTIPYLLICKKSVKKLIKSGKKQTCPNCFNIIDTQISFCPDCNFELNLPSYIKRREKDKSFFYDIDPTKIDWASLKHNLIEEYSNIGIDNFFTNEAEKVVVIQNEQYKKDKVNPNFKMIKRDGSIQLELFQLKQPSFFTRENL